MKYYNLPRFHVNPHCSIFFRGSSHSARNFPRLSETLERQGVPCAAVHGDKARRKTKRFMVIYLWKLMARLVSISKWSKCYCWVTVVAIGMYRIAKWVYKPSYTTRGHHLVYDILICRYESEFRHMGLGPNWGYEPSDKKHDHFQYASIRLWWVIMLIDTLFKL